MLGGELGGVVGGDGSRGGRRPTSKAMRAQEAAEVAEANRLVVASAPRGGAEGVGRRQSLVKGQGMRGAGAWRPTDVAIGGLLVG